MYFLAAIIFAITSLPSTDAFCERLYKNPYWSPKSLAQRALDADIVVYGKIAESPCVKPIFKFVNTTNLPTLSTNATNSSSGVQLTLPSNTSNIDMRNSTDENATDICLRREFYNVTMNVSCVIKGGAVPSVIHLRSFGFGPNKCTYFTRGFTYYETVQSFHVYKGQNYLVFLGRRKGNGDSNSFWPREINLQSASTEIIDEKYLKPVFAAVGGHAHSPEGVDETHSICVPYIGVAPSHYIKHSFLLIVLACGIFLI